MKILMIASYVTIEGRPEFERNKTGFGYMVMDIAKAVGKIEHVDVLATDTRGDRFEYGGVTFIKRSLIVYLLGLFSSLPLGALLSLRKNYSMSNSSFIRLAYYWLMTGYLYKLLKKEKYDVVHVHGCGFTTELWMQVCKRCGQKYVVTLHGLNSFSDTVKLESAGKLYERDFLKRVIDGDTPITVISTGMKRLIEKTYDVNVCDNIMVVCNSFSFTDTQDSSEVVDIRSLYGINSDAKIIVCVGNICERKNQRQTVRAFHLLPDELAENTYFLFLGNSLDDNYSIQKFSANSRWASHFVVCGIIPKEVISNYYEQCNGVALMSLSEGFGLSLIEGMHFGKPCMSFTDVDAFEDIYHPGAMIGVSNHTDEDVADGLRKLLTTRWNPSIIKQYSMKFDSQSMAMHYINVYKAF